MSDTSTTNGNGIYRFMLNIALGIIGTGLALMMAWNAKQLGDQSTEISMLSGRVASLEAIIPLRTAARYTSDDAARDRDHYNEQISDLRQRVHDLEIRGVK